MSGGDRSGPVDVAAMQDAAEDASALMKALANRHRLMILCQLTEGEKSVGELAQYLGLRDSTVSQHLALLRRERLVAPRREGQTIWYRIASDPARAVVDTLYAAFCAAPEPKDLSPNS